MNAYAKSAVSLAALAVLTSCLLLAGCQSTPSGESQPKGLTGPTTQPTDQQMQDSEQPQKDRSDFFKNYDD
jgi:hypothetical protein